MQRSPRTEACRFLCVPSRGPADPGRYAASGGAKALSQNRSGLEVGISFVRFKECGFWARDPALEIWLYLLADEIRTRQAPIPTWLSEAAQEWRELAQLGLVGSIDPGLDEVLTDNRQVAELVEL